MAHKIQIKRGNKADLPTLDDGEFGLCQDTAELFIGNSGNVKVFPTMPEQISADIVIDGVTNKAYTATEKTKLAGIANNANNYSHPTSDGSKHIPTGGSVGQILKNTASGTATWQNETDTNTTYTEITTAEIDAGTASTLRTITARRLKYLLDKIVALFPSKTSELTNDSGFLTSVTKSDIGLGNVTNDKQMPISGGVLENYREKLTTINASGGDINLSVGNVFQHTPSGNRTYTFSNIAASGQSHSCTLIINMETVRTLTFPASVKWQGGEIPDLTTANKIYVLTFMTIDGGTNWLGMFGGEF